MNFLNPVCNKEVKEGNNEEDKMDDGGDENDFISNCK